MANKQVHIVKTNGGWKSTIVGNQRATFVGKTQAEVYKQQRDAFYNGKGGEISIHGVNGQIRNKNTIPPMSDRCPPRG